MPRLPDARRLGGSPVARAGVGVTSYNTSQVGAGAIDLANSIDRAGQKIAGELKTGAEYRAKSDYVKFHTKQQALFDEMQNSFEYGEGRDFEAEFGNLYRQNAAEFARSVPRHMRDEIDTKLFASGHQFKRAANKFQTVQKRRWFDNDFEIATSEYLKQAQFRPEDVDSLVRQGDELVSSLPDDVYDGVDRDKLRRNFARNLSLTAMQSRIDSDPDFAQGIVGLSKSYADKIISVESGGNATAKNPRSTATGAGQFIESTWMEFINERHPELKNNANVLDLRNNPELSREAVQWYGSKNASVLSRNGLPVNDATVYLAHFAGPDGAVKLLQNGNKDVSEVLGNAVVRANPFLKGKTAAEVVMWSARKMGVQLENLSADDLPKLEKYAQQKVNANKAQAKARYASYKDDVELRIQIDPTFGEQDLLSDPAINNGDKATLIKSIRSRDDKINKDAKLLQTITDPDFLWNPLDKDAKKGSDLLIEKADIIPGIVGGDEGAIKRSLAFVKEINMVPPSVEGAVKTMIDGQDPESVERGFDYLDRIYSINPQVAIRDMSKATVDRLMDYKGLQGLLPKDELLKHVRGGGDVISESLRKDRRKAADDVLKDYELGDLLNDLDQSIWPFTEPTASQNIETQSRLMADFANVYRSRFERTGNAESAEKDALDIIRAKWRPSIANNGRLMKDAPELYYPPVDGSYDWMQEQITDDLRKHFGDLTYYNHELIPVTGNPGKYNISVQGENGLFDLVRNDENQPLLYEFDPSFYQAQSRSEFSQGSGGGGL